MIDYPSARFESGFESTPEGPPPLHPLLAALKANAPSSVRDELALLLRQAREGRLSPAGLLHVLLSQDAYGGSAWQEICAQTGTVALRQLLDGISDLIAAGRLDPAEALALFRASDDAQSPALHVLAAKTDWRGLGEYAEALVALHDKGVLPDTDFASVLLQAWNGETLVQRALLGSTATLAASLELLSLAVRRGTITEADFLKALGAPGFGGYDARGRTVSTAGGPSPLKATFMTASVPVIEVVLRKVESLREIGAMRSERLREVMEPLFQSTGSAIRRPSAVLADDVAQAKALVARARERWFAAGPDTKDTATAR
ncbi:hypothetical protein [Mitsuaria sp. 7]|uniref:hypothetical protein n=1 Tax=Mitsuaria sp. 7 TaxID=1658665 RepID=UPI0007DDB9F5|nr:hypothetical protein [Mitsuaria sp. 7]ANH66901.1 hypothetical protein ABE85_03755 [Mitsuaria sp. 7]